MRQVECIGRGKARAAYEFGSVITPTKPRAASSVLHAEALHGNPFVPTLEALSTFRPASCSLSGVRPWGAGVPPVTVLAYHERCSPKTLQTRLDVILDRYLGA
jgi:hypothetical protein